MKAQVTVRIPKDIYQRIKEAARKDDRTASNWILHALRCALPSNVVTTKQSQFVPEIYSDDEDEAASI